MIIRMQDGNGDAIERGAYYSSGMPSDQEYLIECIYDNGSISFTVKENDNSIVATVTTTDDNPLSGEKIGFGGEINHMDDEYIYIDDFKIEVNK